LGARGRGQVNERDENDERKRFHGGLLHRLSFNPTFPG
jgi:hypothetical protein